MEGVLLRPGDILLIPSNNPLIEALEGFRGDDVFTAGKTDEAYCG